MWRTAYELINPQNADTKKPKLRYNFSKFETCALAPPIFRIAVIPISIVCVHMAPDSGVSTHIHAYMQYTYADSG